MYMYLYNFKHVHVYMYIHVLSTLYMYILSTLYYTAGQGDFAGLISLIAFAAVLCKVNCT